MSNLLIILICSYFEIKCAWALLTLFTWAAYSSADKNLWIIPRPPLTAMPIAISYSVTVSIGELTMGTFRGMFFENLLSMIH